MIIYASSIRLLVQILFLVHGYSQFLCITLSNNNYYQGNRKNQKRSNSASTIAIGTKNESSKSLSNPTEEKDTEKLLHPKRKRLNDEKTESAPLKVIKSKKKASIANSSDEDVFEEKSLKKGVFSICIFKYRWNPVRKKGY